MGTSKRIGKRYVYFGEKRLKRVIYADVDTGRLHIIRIKNGQTRRQYIRALGPSTFQSCRMADAEIRAYHIKR